MGSRHWVFTLNNPTAHIWSEMDGPLPEPLRYLVYQEEVGERGTRHFQGYMEFKTPVRVSQVKSLVGTNRIHLERRRGTREQAREYAMKEDTRVDGPFEFGEFKSGGQGKRNDIIQLKELIDSGASKKAIWDAQPANFLRYQRGIAAAMQVTSPPTERPLEVIYCYGLPGTGKSRWAASLGGADSVYWKPKSKWWDGYESQSIVVLDDWDQTWFSWTELLRILDRYPLWLEIKGGSIPARWTKVIITTNRKPWETYNPLKFPLMALFRRVSTWRTFTGWSEPVDTNSIQTFFEGLEVMDWETFMIRGFTGSDPLRQNSRSDAFEEEPANYFH